MPLYEYEEIGTGKTVELFRTIGQRDSVPPGLKRIPMPTRGRVNRGLIDPETPDAAVPRALKQLEQTMSHTEIARQTGFSTRAMKRIWGI